MKNSEKIVKILIKMAISGKFDNFDFTTLDPDHFKEFDDTSGDITAILNVEVNIDELELISGFGWASGAESECISLDSMLEEIKEPSYFGRAKFFEKVLKIHGKSNALDYCFSL